VKDRERTERRRELRQNTATRARRILSGRSDVIEKMMFGGLCFMVNGRMCCGLTNAAFMVRVGPDQYEDALAQPHARPMDFTGRPLAGIVYVDPSGYRTDADLARWIQRGIDFVSTKAAGKKGSKTPPKGRRKESQTRKR
jgi:TfoX/Sxy family transcriptional regulator of competence genes